MSHVADSPQKPPFRPLFRALYPHPADKSALRAEGATHFLAPGKPGRPPTSTWPLFSHHSPLPPTTFPRWVLSSTDSRIGKRPNGARSRRSVSLYSV